MNHSTREVDWAEAYQYLEDQMRQMCARTAAVLDAASRERDPESRLTAQIVEREGDRYIVARSAWEHEEYAFYLFDESGNCISRHWYTPMNALRLTDRRVAAASVFWRRSDASGKAQVSLVRISIP